MRCPLAPYEADNVTTASDPHFSSSIALVYKDAVSPVGRRRTESPPEPCDAAAAIEPPGSRDAESAI
jgi:hypothetical protein